MSIITSFSVFFISFCPLWLSVLFVDVKSIFEGTTHIWTEIISISLILLVLSISFFALIKELNSKDRSGVQEYTIITAEEVKAVTAEFLLSYILPLCAFKFTIWSEVVLFLIFFTVFAFLSIRHNCFCANILLELMRYRFYDCQLKNDEGVCINKIIMSHNYLTSQIGTEISARPVNNKYYIHIFDANNIH